MTPDLSVNIGSLKLKNPVLLASGTVSYGQEMASIIDLNCLGGIITKSVTLKPRKGNPPQRVFETSGGMLNAIGLANVGAEEFIRTKLPFFNDYNIPVICNIAANSSDEYAECVSMLDNEQNISAFEINVSCPNVKEGGLLLGNDPKVVGEITNKVKAKTNKPVIIKLSPNVSYIKEFANIAKQEGADAVTAINTLVGTAFNIITRRPKLQNITGGFSGPAIKPIALAKVLEIKRNIDIPIIGSGGIMDWKDVIEFMIAGASAVQLGTVNFVNPAAAPEIIKGLNEYCIKFGVEKISSLTGSFEL